MRVLVIFFSWTGTTRKVAEALARLLRSEALVTVEEIQPVRSRTYLEWLLLSAIPSSKVRIKPAISDLSSYDIVFLGLPKWTLSCPPVNKYLESISNFEGKGIVPFMTYGGFDQLRFMAAIVSILRRKKMRMVATLAISRAAVKNGAYAQTVEGFLERMKESSHF